MEAILSIPAHERFVLSLAFTPDSKTLLSGGADGLIKLWSAGDWQHQATLAGHTGNVNSIAVSPDGRWVASGSRDATVRLWSFDTGRFLRAFGCRRKNVTSVAFTADSHRVAAASYGGRAKVWNVRGGLVSQLVAGRQNLTSVALSPDGQTAILAGEGGEISVWSLPDGQRLAAWDSRSVSADCLHLIRKGRVLLSLGFERDVVTWDTATWRLIRAYPMDEMEIHKMAVSPDEALVGIVMPWRVHVRSTDDMELQAELPVPTRWVSSVAFSPDGKWIAVGAAEGLLRIWRLRIWT
jgi:WD40 repeat protein